MAHLFGCQGLGVQSFQALAGVEDQLDELVALAYPFTVIRRQPTTGAPLPAAFLLDEGGEGLIEFGVVLYVKALVRQFMEDQRRQAFVAPMHHRTQDRIVEPAQRRVRLYTTDRHVQALQTLQCGLATGGALAVVTAISHATGNGETMILRCQGKLWRGEDIPDYERPANVCVQAIAFIVRQMQMITGERPCLTRLAQVRLELGIASRVGNDLVDRLPGLQQPQLPTDELAVITGARATVQ
ncbi:hypothetical protein SRABI06_05203 [Pseudomonas brassicacearum]|nr:hypothetical protein SRABI06_05203 [Pseudomonas brassicacearum]